jgi:hypothetical protein
MAAGTAAAKHVETAAAIAANRVATTATAAAIADLDFSSLKKARWQIHSTGPFFFLNGFS